MVRTWEVINGEDRAMSIFFFFFIQEKSQFDFLLVADHAWIIRSSFFEKFCNKDVVYNNIFAYLQCPYRTDLYAYILVSHSYKCRFLHQET